MKWPALISLCRAGASHVISFRYLARVISHDGKKEAIDYYDALDFTTMRRLSGVTRIYCFADLFSLTIRNARHIELYLRLSGFDDAWLFFTFIFSNIHAAAFIIISLSMIYDTRISIQIV